jgi:hypothetical protein
MKRAVLAFLLCATPFILSAPCFGESPFTEHKIKALKGLRTVAVVVRPNTQQEVVSRQEWGDMVEGGLHRHVPDLTRSDPQSAPAWLELRILTTDAGGALELSVYRWVTVMDSGEDVFSKMWWDSRIVFGEFSKKELQGLLEALLTNFAADYSRANP